MSVDACWFCAAPVGPGERLLVGMQRDVRYTHLVVAVHTRWQQTWVSVPRCGRCTFGHAVERVTRWIFVASAAITGLPTVLMLLGYATGEPWADTWQFIFLWAWALATLVLWRGVRRHRFGWHRLAPRPERYVREHPAVAELTEDGWQYGGPPGWTW
ncbi:hypothetical protein ACFOVU_24185 [Nocardiopsis sediminis]|uniref:DUF983 domain-containing protein n=1 Tax=Nocardiopsis sediminis TaxID=1778267 RepID=A0ABV8FSB0_9ACTN